MFGKKPFLAKNRAARITHHMASVIIAIDKLVALKGIKITGNTVFIYREILEATPDQAAYVKNLFLYCRTKKLLNADQTLYVKDIEANTILGQYTNEKALLFL